MPTTCAHCRVVNEDAAPACAACGRPLLAVAMPRMPPPPPMPLVPPPPLAPQGVSAAGAPFDSRYTGYAGFWLRLVAFIIDAIVVAVLAFGMLILAALIAGGAEGLGLIPDSDPYTEAAGNALLAIWAVLHWLYRAVLESSYMQATPGKLALRLKVIDFDGKRIGFGRATGRYFASWLSYLLCYLGFLMAGFTERKQALHDMLAGTLVVRR